MSGIGTINLKVVVFDTDYYALQAINSYLAWDRRTRVMELFHHLEDLWAYLNEINAAEYPDVVLIDAQNINGPDELKYIIQKLQSYNKNVIPVCMGQFIKPDLINAAAEAGARAYLLKQEVRLQIAWAICYTLDRDFVITDKIHHYLEDITHRLNERLHHATILPDQREYPEMTGRIRQAIQLCVIEGMPAHLAADEMGISLHTIRGYIKEGYRILEAYDDTEYPVEMTPQERAFMRFTALSEE